MPRFSPRLDLDMGLGLPPGENGSTNGKPNPLCSAIGEGVPEAELRGLGLAVDIGDDLGDRRFISFNGSSGGGGAKDPLLERDLTFSKP